MAQYFYSDVRCGGGKTYWAIQRMASTPGKWVYAVDRREVMAGRAAELRAVAAERGQDLKVEIIRSAIDESDSGGTRQVRQAVEVVPLHHSNALHVVVVVTHASLIAADLRKFTGWSVIIDETPAVLASGSRRSPALVHWLRRVYSLDTETLTGTGWTVIRPTSHAPTSAQVAGDDTLAEWQDFHRRVISQDQPVLCSLTEWEEAANGQPWRWFSVWGFSALQAFTEVIVLANAFTETLAHLVSKAIEPSLGFQPLPIRDAQTWVRRKATLAYFTEGHEAGTAFWATRTGRGCLEIAARWIANHSRPDNHIWTCNAANTDMLAGLGIPGRHLTPRQHGANQFSGMTTASMLYAAKVGPDERLIIEALGLSVAQVVRAREREDLLQFALRTSLRVPGDPRPVELRVYDKAQAKFLSEVLAATGYIDVELMAVDIGILDVTKPKPGRPPTTLVATRTEAERKRTMRAKNREQQISSGTYRPRGRPRKVPALTTTNHPLD